MQFILICGAFREYPWSTGLKMGIHHKCDVSPLPKHAFTSIHKTTCIIMGGVRELEKDRSTTFNGRDFYKA